MNGHAKCRLGAIVLSLLGLLILPNVAGAAEAGPRWHISPRSFPTNLAEGSAPKSTTPIAREALPIYVVSVRNVGGGTASVPVSVAVNLPSGITSDPSLPAEIGQFVRGEVSTTYETCETPTPSQVVCAVKHPVPSGESLKIAIALEVGTNVPSPAVAEVEVSGGGIGSSLVSDSLTVTDGTSEAPFDFLAGAHGLTGEAMTESGQDATRAGSHPFSVLLESNFASGVVGPASEPAYAKPVEPPKTIEFELPRGLVVNPQAPTKLCTERELVSLSEALVGVKGCPAASQVGTITITTVLVGVTELPLSLYDIEPPPGVPAELGFNILGTVVHIEGGLDGKFHLTAASNDILAKYPVLGIQAYLWGNPSDPAHDPERRGRGGCGTQGCALSPDEANTVPLLTMPTSCGEALSLDAGAISWLDSPAAASSGLAGAEGGPLEMDGCNALAFEPTIESKATTDAAEAPTGLEFAIHQPQDESLEGRATAALKNAQVTLPEGMVLNASAADGLGSCTEQQMGYEPSEGKVRFSTEPQTCPDAAKVGTLVATTPLLGHPLPGTIYVARPYDNPFGSLLAIYLAVEDEESGIVAKLAGKVTPDPVTGRLTATFEENPELPLDDIGLEFFGGPTAALTSPLTCGTHTTTSTLTPWSTPEGADSHPTGSFATQAGCYGSEAAAPKTVAFTAGTASPLSGSYSPFVLRLSRPDGSQHITGIDTTLPEGLLARLAGVSYCPQSGIDRAISREAPEKGREEQQDPSCPSSSEVGTVNVTAGSGITPIPVSGHAYLAGPYKGAPLSLVVIVPAVAGPFDLGTVVDRVALNVGEYDARVHAVADPLPTIKDGIPLDVRSIEVKLDHPGFTLNPSSCDAKAIEGSLTTQAGQSASLDNRFQVGECGRLGFRPRIALSLKGQTKKAGHPALTATVTYPPGEYANIASAQVSLPHAEFLDQGNIGKSCTKPVLAAHACPASSVYGSVKAWTPLLDKPLEGNVYLVGGYGYKLPALVAELDGQISVFLVGRIDTGPTRGIRNTFETVPDAPVEKFVLSMKGGKRYGLLENSEDICRRKQTAQVSFTAQNGKTLELQPRIANSCRKGKKHKGKGKGHGKKGHGKKAKPKSGGKKN